jgi:type I pantothenate kinase
MDDRLSPYHIFLRSEWAQLRKDTPMTLTSDEVSRVRSLHVPLDMAEVEEIYLPLSRLLSLYVAATQRLFGAQQNFLCTRDVEMPYIIGVAGSVAVGKSTMARLLRELLVRWPNVPKVDRVYPAAKRSSPMGAQRRDRRNAYLLKPARETPGSRPWSPPARDGGGNDLPW